MKNVTTSTLICLLFLGMSLGNDINEYKENKIKNNPIKKEVRTDKIKQINSVLIQPKPTEVSNYHYNKLKNYNSNDIDSNEILQEDSKSNKIGKTKIWKKEGTGKPKKSIVNNFSNNSYRCEDTDNGAVDSYGDDCAAYNNYPSWCGGYDDDDFQSLDMCCICGGGSTGADDGGDTGGGNDCGSCLEECVYNNISSFCQTYECVGEEPACQMCVMESLSAQNECLVALESDGGCAESCGNVIDPDDCEDQPISGNVNGFQYDSCSDLVSYLAGQWNYDFESACNAQFGFNPVYVDCPDTCGQCDSIGDDGGDDGGECEDTDNGATDAYGDACAAYNNYPSWCGGYDDDDFDSMSMCCICGGGSTGADDGGMDDGGADDGGETGGNGVCEYTECTLTLIDSYGDGWNGNIWSSDNQSAALDDGALGTADLCFDLSIENFYTCDGGSYQGEVSWELVCNGELIVEGGAPASGGFGGSTINGCTDPSADNYDSEATVDDGTCLYGNCDPGQIPCADGVQCVPASYVCDGSIDYGNASWGPDCDDGSDEGADCCETGAYDVEVCLEDCAGNILGGAVLDDSGECCESGLIDECGVCDGSGSLDENGDCCESGYFDECGVCDGMGETCDCSGYSLVVGGGSYDSEITWEIVGPNDGGTDDAGADDGGSDDAGSDDGGVSECVDTDNGAVDSYGDDCAAYNNFPSWCGGYDDDDFQSLDMCCICGGGDGGDDGGGDDGGDTGDEAAASGVAGAFDLCLSDGSYTFNGFDSWGDGWNGATAVITNADGGVLYTFIVEGSSGSWTMELPGNVDTTVYGCTFDDAPNYNPEADEDDGSCEAFAAATCGVGGYFAPWLSYPGFLDCSTGFCVYDIDGDGIADSVGDGICSDGSNASSDMSCAQFNCDGGDCEDCSGDCLGTDIASVDCWDGSVACSDNDCPEIPDCPQDTCELIMIDSYGDGWNGATFNLGDQSTTLESGSEGIAILCADLSTANDFTVGGGSYDSEISWILDCADGNPLSGGAPYSGCFGTDCSEPLTCDEQWNACVDSLIGTEYYEACSADDCVGGPGGECDGNVVPGLTDQCGFAASNIVSGDCEDPCGGGADDGGGPDLCFGLVIAMFDSYGDGWNGNVLTIGDETFSLDDTIDGDGLTSGTACYEGPTDVVVTCGGGSYQSEVSWNIFDYTGSVVLNGGAPFEGCLGDCDGGASDGGADDCVDTDNGAVDSYGDDCAAYNSFPSWCGNYDDDDFNSLDMCCICGGGDSSGTGDGGDDGGDDCLLGDNNDDETINVQDIILVVNYIMGTSTDDLPCGDMNDDGAINVQDIVTVVNIIMGTSARVDSATEATLVIRNNDLLLRSNGFVQGIQLTLSHGDDFSINLEEEYISETLTSRNHTKIVLVTDGLSTLDKIGDTNGAYTILSSIVSDNNANSILTNQITEITDFMLTDAFPNPFNPTTNLSLVLSEAGYVSVKIYNIVGQEVAVLADGMYEANINGHQLTWDASNVSSGVYIVRAESSGQISTQKLMLLK